MNMGIFIIKKGFSFFKVFSSKIFTFLDALKAIVEALFPLRFKHLQNSVLNRFNSIFWRLKSLTTHFSFDVRE